MNGNLRIGYHYRNYHVNEESYLIFKKLFSYSLIEKIKGASCQPPLPEGRELVKTSSEVDQPKPDYRGLR